MEITCGGRLFSIAGFSDDDLIVQRLRDSGTFYEIDLLRYLTRMRLPHGVAIDVGAQIGNHAVYFGSFLADRVVCVEPNPAVLPLLRRNTAANPGRYTIIEAGLGAEAGTASLHQPDAGNTGTMQLATGQGDIMVTTLDAIAPDGVTLVKIDVEGMELDVLRGGVQLLQTQRPDLVLEASTAAAFEAQRALLAPLGYVPLARWAVTPTWHFAHRPSLFKRLRARWLVREHRLKRWISGRLSR